MPLYTDLPTTDAERQKMLNRALTDRTRCVAIGNQFDNFDYSTAKNGINDFVEASFQRITSIITETMESFDGSATQATRSDHNNLR
jgi:hypothetical protein